MKKLLLTILNGFLLIQPILYAQQATFSEKSVPIKTYPFSDPNPVPEFGKIYPYFRYDGYADKGVVREWKMVEMENDYIKLWVTPGIGGKIWGAIEKSTGKEFIYYNHAVKFRDVSMRGPWTSGGIEINFGIIGHAPTCASPVDYLVRKNDDGSVSCFVGAIDLLSETRWSVEINLPKDKACFTTRSVWDNPTSQEQPYYHWMNLGVKTAGDLEYIFPGNYHLGHDGKPSPWPVDEKGRNISFYENNNFGGSKSYHVLGEPTGLYGAYWHKDDFGFVHYSLYDDKPGKKVWIWGLSDQGMIWENLLTDTDGQYTEIQSGRLFNQAGAGSSDTPFKQRGFAAGSTDEWTEYWFPVKQTQGLKSALPEGSVNLRQQGNSCTLWFCPNEKVNGILEVRNKDKIFFSKEIHCDPMRVETGSFENNGSYKNLSVWLNDKLLFDADQEKQRIKRPVEPPAGFNKGTAYGHYLQGRELERQRWYKPALAEYRKALEAEPWFAPALTGMANLSYRKTDYRTALDYSLKALSVDTYDSEANMIYGLAGLAVGDTISAIDGFSIASAGVSQRSAAYNALASICLGQGDHQKALSYAEKSLVYNQLGSEAIQLKILCLRKLGLHGKAGIELNELEKKDPLNHFIRFEKYLANSSTENKVQVQKYITNELPQETYLEYALWYFRQRQLADALKVLELAPQNHPVVLLWESYLNQLNGNKPAATATLKKALQQSPELVFPFRVETLKPLEWAKTLSDDWKVSYYTGLIYLNAGAEEKGLQLWEDCGNRPDFYPFYISRSNLDTDKVQRHTDVKRALALAGNDWRTGLFASKFYLKQGNLQKAEELARNFYLKNPQNYYLGLHYAKLLVLGKKYAACIGLLQEIKVLPNEGASEGRTIWRNANLGNALDLLNAKKYKKVLESIDRARQWPENMGVGKPYQVDERLEDFISLQCYKKLEDDTSAKKMKGKIIGETDLPDLPSGTNDFLSAWIWREAGDKPKADLIMSNLLEKNPSSKPVQWCKAIYSGDVERAKTINEEVDNDDESFLFLKRVFEASGLY